MPHYVSAGQSNLIFLYKTFILFWYYCTYFLYLLSLVANDLSSFFKGYYFYYKGLTVTFPLLQNFTFYNKNTTLI